MSFMNYAVANSTESGAGQVIWLQFQKNPNHYANFIENPFELWINSYTQYIASTFEWKHLFDQVLCWASNSVGKQRSYISSFIYINQEQSLRGRIVIFHQANRRSRVYLGLSLWAPQGPPKSARFENWYVVMWSWRVLRPIIMDFVLEGEGEDANKRACWLHGWSHR